MNKFTMKHIPDSKPVSSPLIFAHRGANSFAPENSIPAFEAAIRIGCDGIEMDVRLTASGDIIIFHDRRLNRMTGCRGNVHQMTLSQIRQVYLESNPHFRIPTLQEVLEVIGDRILINIDVKKETMRQNGLEEKILSILRDFRLKDNIVISSFNPLVLKKFADLAPDYRLGFIYRQRSHKFISNGVPVESFHVYHRMLSRKYITNLHQQNYRVYAWTVDKERHFRRMLKIGVDGIITNHPEVYYRLIQGDGIEKGVVVQEKGE